MDLLSALDAGLLSSALLDVLVDAPPAAHDPVFRHPRMIVTLHIAGTTHPATVARKGIAAIDRRRTC